MRVRETHDLNGSTGIHPVLALTARFPQLSFDELRDKAAEMLADLIPGATLEVSGHHAAGHPLRRGFAETADGGRIYQDYYFGPPEPVWFTARLPDGDAYSAAAFELFFRHLTAALTTAGHKLELQRQSRRSWVSGLQRQQGFERQLARLEARGRVLGLISLDSETEATRDNALLAIRRLGRNLRAALTDAEHAFHLDNDQLAILIPENARFRYEALLAREVPQAAVAWVGLTEARGLEVLKLAEARLLGMPPTLNRQPPSGVLARAEANPLLSIHSGSEAVLQLARNQLGDWRFRRHLNLIYDEPVGYAMELLPQLSEPSVVVTNSSSMGYLLDLTALRPGGVLLEPVDLQSLRNNLERVAVGERVYSGPLLDDPLLPRERLVWRLTANGIENAEIAELIGVSMKTVANYLSTLQEKLGFSDKAALALGYWHNPED